MKLILSVWDWLHNSSSLTHKLSHMEELKICVHCCEFATLMDLENLLKEYLNLIHFSRDHHLIQIGLTETVSPLDPDPSTRTECSTTDTDMTW